MAATPPSRDDLLAGWPGERLSEVGRILDSLRLRGMLSARGSITTEPGSAAPPRVLVEARLSDGAIQPNPSVSESSPGIFWPAGFALTECDAAFTIDDQWVRLDEFRGRLHRSLAFP